MTKRITEALREAEAELVRSKKHYVYRFPNDRAVTISRTPAGHRWEQNILRDIKHVRGM